MPLPWLPPPEPGTAVCGGFDGSEVDDLTVIKLETFDGYLFTPRYGPDDRPTIWKPEDWGGRIPRHQVSIAWEQIAKRYRLQRVYCDPFQWQTDIEQWVRVWPRRVRGVPDEQGGAHLPGADSIHDGSGAGTCAT